jgi:hypothetical protein
MALSGATRLVVDRDGALLLASSSSANKEHAIARIDVRVRDAAQIDGIERGHRALGLPPVVDGTGYTLVLRKSNGKCKGFGGKCVVDRERESALQLEPATLAHVGAQL